LAWIGIVTGFLGAVASWILVARGSFKPWKPSWWGSRGFVGTVIFLCLWLLFCFSFKLLIHTLQS
jgi:hypothetical protein